MISCCQRHRMRWSGATGAIARGKNTSTRYARRDRSVHAWHWICGVKPKLKAVNKPSPHFIVHGLGKPGSFTTVSIKVEFRAGDRHQFQAVHPETLQICEPVDDAVKHIIELLDLQFIYDEVIEFRRLIRRIGPHEWGRRACKHDS